MKKVQRISYLEILEIILLDQLPLFWASQRPFIELHWQAEKHFDEEREVHEQEQAGEGVHVPGVQGGDPGHVPEVKKVQIFFA